MASWAERSPHRNFDNEKVRWKEKLERLCAGQSAVGQVVATFVALVEGQEEMDHNTRCVFEEEALRKELGYTSSDDFFIHECGISPGNPLLGRLSALTDPERRIARLEVDDPQAVQVAALTAMWYYKCHSCAQVYVRIPEVCQDLKRSFWKQLRDISLRAPDLFAEEQAADFGKMSFRHIQRRTGVFITNTLPRVFSDNVMFVFGGGADWYHETARKIYLR